MVSSSKYSLSGIHLVFHSLAYDEDRVSIYFDVPYSGLLANP